MAKVVMPLLSGEVRGKVGDIVFFKKNGLQLARMRSTPTNPKTPKQMAIRENLGGLSKLWKGQGNITLKKFNPATGEFDDVVIATGLTEEERMAWVNAGKSKAMEGRLLFIGVNISGLNMGEDFKRTP
jgi:hypothetical protein